MSVYDGIPCPKCKKTGVMQPVLIEKFDSAGTTTTLQCTECSKPEEPTPAKPPPEAIDNPRWSPVKDAAQDMVAWAVEDYCEDRVSNHENAIFEAVMETVYGKEFWGWWNNEVAK